MGFWVGFKVGPREVDLRGLLLLRLLLLFSFSSLEDERDGNLREVERGVMDLGFVVVVGLMAPSITAAQERRVDMVMSENIRRRKKLKKRFFERLFEVKNVMLCYDMI
jgi:hypothetical protein